MTVLITNGTSLLEGRVTVLNTFQTLGLENVIQMKATRKARRFCTCSRHFERTALQADKGVDNWCSISHLYLWDVCKYFS